MYKVRDKILGKRETVVKTKEKVEDHEHKTAVTQQLKVIWSCDMPGHLKRIMTARIWGINPEVFYPLTPEQIVCLNKNIDPGMIAAMYKNDRKVYGYWCRDHKDEIDQIKEYEEQGKFHCEQFLLSVRAQEIVDKFNENYEKNKGQIFDKTIFGRKSFSV